MENNTVHIIAVNLIFNDINNYQKHFYAIHLKIQHASNLKLWRTEMISMKTRITLFLEK